MQLFPQVVTKKWGEQLLEEKGEPPSPWSSLLFSPPFTTSSLPTLLSPQR